MYRVGVDAAHDCEGPHPTGECLFACRRAGPSSVRRAALAPMRLPFTKTRSPGLRLGIACRWRSWYLAARAPTSSIWSCTSCRSGPTNSKSGSGPVAISVGSDTEVRGWRIVARKCGVCLVTSCTLLLYDATASTKAMGQSPTLWVSTNLARSRFLTVCTLRSLCPSACGCAGVVICDLALRRFVT